MGAALAALSGLATHLEGMRLTPCQPIDQRTPTETLAGAESRDEISRLLGDGLVGPID